MTMEELTQRVKDTLGRSMMVVHSTSLMGIKLIICVRRTLFWLISKVESAQLPTKLAGMVGTKGAAGISLEFDGVSILFVNSHLTAHQNNIKQRNADFHTICRNLGLPHKDHIQQHMSLVPSHRRAKTL